MIERSLFEKLNKYLFRGKVILLFGTRRVGKTTLLKSLIEHCKQQRKQCIYMNCDTIRAKQALETTDDQKLEDLIKDFDILAIDEAQNVEGIGKTLKIINDEFPKIQVIATGSSSFDLANKTGEPLVGRMLSFVLYPFSMHELRKSIGTFNIDSNLERFLKFGLYPTVYNCSEREAKNELETFVNGYLYKDLLTFDGIKNTSQILKLLQCLALQIGSEVSFNELSSKLEISANTVKRYIDLLEKCFVLFTLPALSRNMRNEIAGNRTRKVYFYDIGVRNALIGNYQDMRIRVDAGNVWENFCVVELKKKAQREDRLSRFYFWRTYEGKEVDLVEEENGKFKLYEFKLNPKKNAKIPKGFAENYDIESFTVVNKENWWRIIG